MMTRSCGSRAWRLSGASAWKSALLAALGDRYRSYAAHHKRLIPLIW